MTGKKEKPLGQHWKLLDIISFTMMGALVMLFMLIFTPLGDSLAASGQQYLDGDLRADSTSSGEYCDSCPMHVCLGHLSSIHVAFRCEGLKC
jgi:hypothetical protein